MTTSDSWEVFAARFSAFEDRLKRDNFIFGDQHDGPGPVSYYVWVARRGERVVLVDTGFDEAHAKARGRTLEVRPCEAIAAMDITPAQVTDVVVTHLHWDHAGTMDDFPDAVFHVQDKEVQYATGRCMCHGVLRGPYAVDHVTGLVRKVYESRVQFHDGEAEIAPGLSLHLIGGHTMGVQCVRVQTRRGPVVLASDTVHFYDNLTLASPFPIVYDVAAMLEGFNTLRRLAATEHHIVPGHDPLVMARYPAPSEALKGRIALLDVEPSL